jgi:RHS repeat-associated protein
LIDCYETGKNKGKVKQTVDQNGNELTYNYYPDESRYTVTDSNGKKTTYWYDESYYNIITVDSENGFSKTTYYLDSKGENKYGEAKIVIDRNGNKTTYERDEVGNITKIINPDLSEKEFGYDSNNNIIWEKDEEGNFTQHVYEGNLLKQTAKRFEKLTSNDRNNYPTVSEISTDKYAITDYDYYDYSSFNIYGLLKSETQNMGKDSIVIEYDYHPNGNIKSVKNPQTGKLTLYSDVDYTPDYGWKTTETSPEGNITEYHYNDNGQMIETIKKDAKDAKKVSNTVTVYDNCGRKKQEVPANLYDKYIAEGKSPDIGTRYSYNKKGQLESLTDAEDNVTKYHSYDIYGNVQVEEKPNGGVYKYEYDSFSRLLKVWFKDTMKTADTDYKLLVEYSYIAAQNPQKVEIKHLNDSEVARTTYTSDYAGRTVKITYPADEIGQSPTVVSKYYKNGELKEFTDKNGFTTYYNNGNFDSAKLQKYDEKWTPVELEGTKVKYNYSRTYYDNAGRVVEEWTSSELVDKDAQPKAYIKKTTGYYKDGKVKFELYSDGRSKEYDYDFDRNLNKEITKKNDTENIIVEYENNYLGKPDTKKLYVNKGDIYTNNYSDSGEEIIQTTYTYDKLGNVKTVETDNVNTEDDLTDSNIVTYNYDNMGRNIGTEEYVVTEDGTIKKLTSTSKLNWEGNPLTVQQLVDDVVTRTNTYKYNQRGFLETVTDAMPAPKTGVTYYGYDLAGRKVCEVAPKDYIADTPIDQLNRSVFTYDALDRVLNVSYVGMMGNFDASGNWVEPTKQSVILQKAYTYDKAGNVLKEIDGEGNATQYAYNPSNKVKAVLDQVSADKGIKLENAPQRFNYDALGRKVEEITTREEKNSTEYTTYDSFKIFVYDDAGNVKFIKSKKNSSATEITLEASIYDYLGNAIIKIDGNENSTNYTYNNLGKVRSVVTPGDDNIKSNTVYYQYDKAGNLRKTIDTKGTEDSTDDVYQLFKYDNRGKMLSSTIQKQDGTQKVSTSTSYDIYGNKHFETDGNLNTTTYIYNELNQLVKSSIDVFDVDNVKTTHTKNFDYDKNGNLISETDYLNNSVTYTYDSLNRLREKKDQYQKSIEKINYYADNTQSESFDALNHKTTFVYDKNNKLLSTKDAEGHVKSNTYDITGNVKTKDDGRGNITYYGYDEYGNLTEVSINVDKTLQTTVYKYDLNGNMTSQSDAKLNKTIYNYNAANKLEKIYVEGQTDSEDYIYNPDGSLYQKTDKNGVTSTYTYYANGKLESQTVGKEGTEGYVKTSYIYDGNGNLINATETTLSNGVLTTIETKRDYDELNRVKSKTEYDSSTAEDKRVENKFKYDIVPVAKDLPGITANLEGTTGERSIILKNNAEISNTLKIFDKAGRLKYIVANGQTTTYEYYDNGNRQSVSYPGGMKEEYVYYDDNLLKTLINYKTENGKLIQIDKYDYTYDAAHNQDSKTEFVNGESKGKTIFDYDELNRLKSVTEPSLQITEYKYDAAGNREKETVSINGTTIAESTYDYNAMNWLQTLDKVDYDGGSKKTTNYTYNYDKNGNQTGVIVDGVTTVTYQYDNLNRLTNTAKDGKDYTYSYNADGLRVKKADESGTTLYLYESQKVVMELDAAGDALATNVYGTNLITRTVEGTTLYYMYNGHADVTALLDTKGNLVGSYYYDAWGNILESSGSMKDKNSILYAGYQYDSETELYYLNARMYDPKVARFLQEDTYRGEASDPLSLNLYTYCHNEPVLCFLRGKNENAVNSNKSV